jgi:hypothetical protein
MDDIRREHRKREHDGDDLNWFPVFHLPSRISFAEKLHDGEWPIAKAA